MNQRTLGIAFIVVATLIVYLPALGGGFILDDAGLVHENGIVRAPNGLQRFWFSTEPDDYWPMTNSSFWLEWRLWGPNPTGYRLTNLALHIASALLLWEILSRLSIPGAFLAAILFAVHPVNVESVAWIAQRKNTLAMLFFLVSILWYLRADDESSDGSLPKWYWLSLLAFVAAMLSKGSVAVQPLMLLLIVWWRRRQISKSDVLRTVPFFLVAAILTAVNIWFQTHGSGEAFRTATFAERLAGAGGVVWFYLGKALLPIRLIFVYPQWQIHAANILWWLPLLAAIGFTTALLRHRNRQTGRPLLFAWLFFCIALLPVLGFTDVGFMQYSLVADHYQHIAIIAVVTLAAAAWYALRDRMQQMIYPIFTICAAVTVGVLMIFTWRQNELYGAPIELYRATIEANPDCWMAHNNLGILLARSGKLPAAVEQYKLAIQLKASDAEAQSNLGTALAIEGRFDDAVAQYQHALEINPDLPDTMKYLANTLFRMGRLPEAIHYYEESLKRAPDFADAYFNLGAVLLNSDRPEEAIQQFQLGLQLEPGNAQACYNLGNACLKLSRLDEAIASYQQAVRLKPDYTEAWCNLMATYDQMGNVTEAIRAGRRALELARSQGQSQLIQQLGAWLNSHGEQLP